MVIYWEELHVYFMRFRSDILEALKKSPGVLKLIKMKLNKNMSDDAAAKICLIWAGVILVVGIFLFILGAIQGAA